MRVAAAALVLTAAIVSSTAIAGAGGPATAQDAGGTRDRVGLENWRPLPAASQTEVSPAARRARERLLGPHADDPRYATLHWTGVSSFVVTLGGHLFLLDAWEILGLHRDYLPLGREDLAALDPEVILLGHGHFDHAADAGYVAGRTGAPVLASDEQCDTVKEDAAEEGRAARFLCVITGSQTEPPPGRRTRVRLFADLPPVTILKSVHSAPRPPGEANPLDPYLPVFDPQPYIEHLNDSPRELARFLASLPDPEGGTRMYHLRDGRFSLLLGDSAGPIFEYPRVRRNLDRLPGCVDVMANAIQGFDQPVSGVRDPRLYIARAHPRVFLPTHGDAWAPVISPGQARYRDELADQLARLRHPPRVDFLLDPQDYLEERAYRVTAPRWRRPMPGSSCARRG
jgi:Metallo-beta-lactamase superfamily